MKRPLSIAIDGPVGVGKSSAARALARKLGFLYIDTGAMYRAVTLSVLEKGIDPQNKKSVAELAKKLQIDLRQDKEILRISLDGRDVTGKIRTPAVSKATSPIADNVGVREEMVAQQKEMAKRISVVMEGRDITTVVLPDAEVKFYIDGDETVRAERRHRELREKGVKEAFKDTLKDLRERDTRDKARLVGALTCTPDSIYIDTTHLNLSEVVNQMYEEIIKRFPERFNTDK